MLIDLFQRMLEREIEAHGFQKEVILADNEKSIICGLHDNISFRANAGVELPAIASGKWVEEVMPIVVASTPSVMLLHAPRAESYLRFQGYSSPPDKMGYGDRAHFNPLSPSYAYCARIELEDVNKHRVENRLPSADANPFEVTIGTLLVFYNALRRDPILSCCDLPDDKAGMKSLEDSIRIFNERPLLKLTLDELSEGLGTRLHSAILRARATPSLVLPSAAR